MEAKLAKLKKSRDASKGHLTKTGIALAAMVKADTSHLRQAAISASLTGLEKQLATHQTTFDLTIAAAELDTDDMSELQDNQYREYEEELEAAISKIDEFKAAFAEQALRLQLCGELDTINDALSCMTISNPTEGRRAAKRIEEHGEEYRQLTRDYPEVLRTDDHLRRLRRDIATRLEELRSLIPEEETTPAPTLPSPSPRARSRSPSDDRYGRRRGLPKLDIPIFTGNIHNFPYWWKQFNKFVHQDVKFDDSDKLTYLKQTFQSPNDMVILDGEGAGPGLYATYIREIKETYDRPRMVHRDYTKELFAVKPMTDDSTAQLKLLYSTVNNTVLKLEATGQYNADSIITSHVELLMTQQLRGKWKEYTVSQRQVPPIKELLAFLVTRKHAQDEVEDLDEHPVPVKAKPEKAKQERRDRYRGGRTSTQNYRESYPVQTKAWPPCKLCKTATHPLYTCPTYLAYNSKGRADYVRNHKLCSNCLGGSHDQASCRNTYRCRDCGAKHHSTLHQPEPAAAIGSATVNYATANYATRSNTEGVSIAPTLELVVSGANETETPALALFDTGSSISLVTNDVAIRMGLRKQTSNTRIVGVEGASSTKTAPTVNLTISSTHRRGIQLNATAFVVSTISGRQDRAPISYQWDKLGGLQLANPNFRQPQNLDILLGNDVLGRIEMAAPILKDHTTGVTARKTIFGWVVNGSTSDTRRDDTTERSEQYVCTATGAEVNPDLLAEQRRTTECMQQFVTSEDMPEEPTSSTDDAAALTHYGQTHQILDNGRFQVALPRPLNGPELGLSRNQAVRRYMSNERSLLRKEGWKAFQAVVTEYLELGHAEVVPQVDLLKTPANTYYLPMHAVYKESSSSPLRVVFDASADTSTGHSLNDTLLTGPTVYPALTDILMRFRLHRVAITADITKMFRCISLDPKDRDFHRFVWRQLTDGTLLDYRMTRVTFGVSCSPFLATQTLQEIATLVSDTHPLAAAALRTAFYVDDCITGTDTESQAMELQQEIQEVLQQHQLTIKKWRSNSIVVLGTIPDDLQEREPERKPYGPQHHLKTLGIHWDAEGDAFRVSTSKLQSTTTVTKRTLASDVAQTFDVLGWFSPATLMMKVLIQELWRDKLDWDDPAGDKIQQQWQLWKSELPQLANKPIPRYYFRPQHTPDDIQLHGFCDASLKGYAAAVYVRATYINAPPTVRLIMAKTKVARVKGTTVPRLELCGAQLLAEVIVNVQKALALQPTQLRCWCDSQVVLYWLGNPRKKTRVYVTNRVARTLDLTSADDWRHVPGKDNPADCASRGLTPLALAEHSLWWNGPPWLSENPIRYPPQPVLAHLEKNKTVTEEVLAVTDLQPSLWDLGRSSTFNKTRRVLAWSQRFCHNTRAKRQEWERRCEAELTGDEVRGAETTLFLQSQGRIFGGQHPERWSTDKHTRNLNPRTDVLGVYRVNGRLENSSMAYAALHPIILKGSDPLTRQLIRHHHYTTLHGGPAQMLTSLSRRFYIINGMAIIKAIFRSCVICLKFGLRREKQMMGQLPNYRINPGKVFDIVGTDFAGPITVNEGNPRRPRKVKAYICVYVCMATKAIHLEAVMGLSTGDFLACLRRFVARRGKPAKIMSDNGTNFTGASREIEAIFQEMRSAEFQNKITRYCTDEGIEWAFSPARAPHFGGMWEATVKAVKHHLRRLEYQRTFTYEQMTTTLCQIEAVLNSRPLMAIHCHSTEGLEVLTAGHFLIGRPLTSIPEPMQPFEGNLPKRWDQCQQATQRFWREWTQDYLRTFHKRSKWMKPARNVEVGDIVLLREEVAFHTNDWPLGRVVRTFPGQDGLVRAVDLQVGKTIKRRPIVKLTVLVPVKMTEGEDGSLTATRISPGGGCSSLECASSNGRGKKVSFEDDP